MSTLDVQDLSINYGTLRAVRGVSFQIAPGEAYGLIGESGSGKTTIAYAVMRYLRGGVAQGRLTLAGRDVMTMTDAELTDTRGKIAAMVYQDPMSALNPAIKVGEQIAEAIRLHSPGQPRRRPHPCRRSAGPGQTAAAGGNGASLSAPALRRGSSSAS